LLASMQSQQGDWEWVVTDFSSTDGLWDTIVDPRVKIIQVTGDFWKTKGLNRAAEIAEGDIIFFLDVDLVLPPDLIKRIIRHTFPGQVYFPIKYNLHEGKPREFKANSRDVTKANGYWFKNGPGECAFINEDFLTVGRWNESYRYWGGEDKEMLRMCRARLKIFRENVPGLFHRWHPRGEWYWRGRDLWRRRREKAKQKRT
jgi:glycosyltransferase involved in cell wall biosynthesis